MHLLIVVVELPDLGGDLADLPSLQPVLGVEDLAVLLLELPQLGVDVEGAAEVRLPLLVPVLGQVPAGSKTPRDVTRPTPRGTTTHRSPLNSCLDFSSR